MTPLATTSTTSPKSLSSDTPWTLTDSLQLPHCRHKDARDTSRTDAENGACNRACPARACGRAVPVRRCEWHALDSRGSWHRAAGRARQHDRTPQRQDHDHRPETVRQQAPSRLWRDEDDLQERQDDDLPGQERPLPPARRPLRAPDPGSQHLPERDCARRRRPRRLGRSDRERLLRRHLVAERLPASIPARHRNPVRAGSTHAAIAARSGILERAMPMNAPQTVLVVEDEASIASFVSLYLKNAGYDVHVAETGEDALTKAENQQPSLIVLDLMLPDIDGIEVCRRIRRRSDVPILMLTARDEDVDKIIGLEVGADDYLTKPFNPRELVARVKSILRRSTPDRKEVASATITHGDLTVDAGRREVTVGDEEIKLAPKEFDLLWELLDHRGLVLTRDQLLERVWGYTFAGDTRTVDVHVRQLRRKLGEASPIVTVWGVGYKVTPAKEAAATA